MKPKKRKADIDYIIDEMSNGCTVYDPGIEDDMGMCGFCYELSFKEHKKDCPVQVARDLLEERKCLS